VGPLPDGRGIRFVLNPNSGTALGKDPIDVLRERLPGAEIVELDDESTCEQLLQAEPRPLVAGVVGGDGTVSAVAAVAHEMRLPLAVIPAGTLNHFTHDLGLDSVDDGIDAVIAGATITADIAAIDEHKFVNNASIGAYPQIVDARERLRRYIGKWPALLVALVYVLRRGHPSNVAIDGRERRLWFAFFGNCHYDMDGIVAPSGRSTLNDGLIDVRLVHADVKWARLRLFTCVVLRRLDRCSVYESATLARITVRSLDGPLRLAADGETFDGGRAFEIRKWPSGLTVYAPRGSGDSGSMS
jgi:undecaprenyl-diphosphatase